MEQIIHVGDDTVYIYKYEYKKELEVNCTHFISFPDGKCVIKNAEYESWNLSKEELCTFIKLLVSHLELPLEFK